MKVPLGKKDKIFWGCGVIVCKTQRGSVFLGKQTRNHESYLRFCVGDLRFLRKLLCHSLLSGVDWKHKKADPVLFPKSHDLFWPRHSRNTLSISLNNATRRQSAFDMGHEAISKTPLSSRPCLGAPQWPNRSQGPAPTVITPATREEGFPSALKTISSHSETQSMGLFHSCSWARPLYCPVATVQAQTQCYKEGFSRKLVCRRSLSLVGAIGMACLEPKCRGFISQLWIWLI